jgi:trypsin
MGGKLAALAILLALAVASSAGAESRRSASRSTHHRATRVEPAIRRARWRWPVRKWPTSLVPAARVLRSQYTGTRRRPQIVGGSGGVQGQWPFMAFIQHSDSAGNPDFWCSGTLVSSNVVLTAGHCAVDETTGAALDPSGYAVATGAVDWTNTANRQVSSVSQVNVYPAFDPSGPTHDAALLVLSSPLNAAPIALWASGGLSAGTSALIAGWGMTSAGQASPTALLQWAPTVVQSATDCRQKAALASFPYDTSTNLCAVNPPTYSTGTCNGDSGGPLLAQGASGTLVEIGLTSVGPTDCNTQQPDDFTAILPIASWVRNEASAVAPVTSRPTPSGAAPAPSGPSTSGTGSSAGTTPAALPSMTFPDARKYARQVLGHVFARLPHEHTLKQSCARLSDIRVQCAFTFWSGPNDYWGSVAVYYYTGSAGTIYWTDRYRTKWVNDRCYFHTNHRRSCATHPNSGSW